MFQAGDGCGDVAPNEEGEAADGTTKRTFAAEPVGGAAGSSSANGSRATLAASIIFCFFAELSCRSGLANGEESCCHATALHSRRTDGQFL